MHSSFTGNKFPWGDSLAQKLHHALVSVEKLRDIAGATLLLQQARMDPAQIAFDGIPAFLSWSKILDLAITCGRLEALLQLVLADTRCLAIHSIVRLVLQDDRAAAEQSDPCRRWKLGSGPFIDRQPLRDALG